MACTFPPHITTFCTFTLHTHHTYPLWHVLRDTFAHTLWSVVVPFTLHPPRRHALLQLRCLYLPPQVLPSPCPPSLFHLAAPRASRYLLPHLLRLHLHATPLLLVPPLDCHTPTCASPSHCLTLVWWASRDTLSALASFCFVCSSVVCLFRCRLPLHATHATHTVPHHTPPLPWFTTRTRTLHVLPTLSGIRTIPTAITSSIPAHHHHTLLPYCPFPHTPLSHTLYLSASPATPTPCPSTAHHTLPCTYSHSFTSLTSILTVFGVYALSHAHAGPTCPLGRHDRKPPTPLTFPPHTPMHWAFPCPSATSPSPPPALPCPPPPPPRYPHHTTAAPGLPHHTIFSQPANI